MEIRVAENQPIRVPAEDGAVVEVRVQGMQVRAAAANGEAVLSLPARLHWGSRTSIYGRVWRGKHETRLIMERAYA